MLNGIRDFLAGVVVWFYTRVFGKPAGPVSRNFMKNVTYVFVGLLVAKVFSLFFQIYVGRSIGATEYGKYALVFSLAQFLWVPMLMGIGMATVKYLSSLENEKDRKALVSTSVAMVAVLSLLFAGAFIAAADAIAGLASVTRLYAVASVAVALLYAAWTYSQDILKGLGEMKMVGVMNVIHAVTIVGLSLVLLTDTRTAAVPVVSICGGYLLSASAVFIFSGQRRYVALRWKPWLMMDRKWARVLLGYGGIAVVAIFSSSVVGNINQLLINRFLDLETVGVYQAYYMSTIGVVTFFVNIIVTVFFPESSRYADKSVIFRQMRRLFLLAPVLFFVVCAASFVIITLYGSGYPVMPDVMVMFALSTVFVFLYTIYNVFSSSLGMNGIKATTASIIMISVIGAVSSCVLIPLVQIRGAVFSIMLSHAIGLIAIYLMAGRLLKEHDSAAPHKKHREIAND